MKRSENNGRYILQNELRTWSELKRRAAKEKEEASGNAITTPSRSTPLSAGGSGATSSPTIPIRRWGGCVNGCNHDKINYPRRPMRKNTMEYQQAQQLLPPAATPLGTVESEKEDHPVAAQDPVPAPIINEPSPSKLTRKQSTKANGAPTMPPTPASPNDASNDASTSEDEEAAASTSRSQHPQPRAAAILRHLQPPLKSPNELFSDDSDYFPGMQHLHNMNSHRKVLRASSKQRQQSKERKLARRQTEQNWKDESGMGNGAKTDRLGDGGATSDEAAASQRASRGESILPEALKGNMVVENSAEDAEQVDGNTAVAQGIDAAEVDKLKDADRKGFGEVY